VADSYFVVINLQVSLISYFVPESSCYPLRDCVGLSARLLIAPFVFDFTLSVNVRNLIQKILCEVKNW